MKKVILYLCGFLATVTAIIFVFIIIKNVNMSDGAVSYNMYYIDKGKNELSIEKRVINLVNSDSVMFTSVVDTFAAGPQNSNTGLLLPPQFKINSRRYDNKTAFIDLAESFNELPAGEKVLCVGALVYTITDMSFIDNINLTIAGQPYMTNADGTTMVFNRENLRNNPVIATDKTQWQTVTLYFGAIDGKSIVAEQRSIQVKQSLTLEYQIVEQLIAGPDKTMLVGIVPKHTKINDIKTEEGICYVNLSDDFIKSGANSVEERKLIIYSIVNSLTELQGVNKVQFLIDGEKINAINNIDFSKPFDRNESVIK